MATDGTLLQGEITDIKQACIQDGPTLEAFLEGFLRDLIAESVPPIDEWATGTERQSGPALPQARAVPSVPPETPVRKLTFIRGGKEGQA